MRKFSLTHRSVISLLIASAFPFNAYSAVANVEFSIGSGSAIGADGQTRSLSKGLAIQSGDTLKTLDGRAQIRFVDGGYISLQPNTEFKVEDYNYSGKSDGSEKGFFQLLKGGMRAITGSIGKANKQNYRVNTPTATIGIRGTEFLAQQDGDKLLVKVGDGAVFLENAAGNIVLYQGQSGEVGGQNQAPKQTEETPSVTAAGPNGSTSEDLQEEKQTEQTIYVDGNVRLDNESLCQVGSSSCVTQELEELEDEVMPISIANVNALLTGGIANIPALGQIFGAAEYSAANTLTIGGSTFSVDEFLVVDFSTLQAFFEVFNSSVPSSGLYSGHSLEVSADGTVNGSTGVFSFTSASGEIVFGTNSNPLGVTVTGGLNASNLTQANITYALNDPAFSTSATVTTLLDGTDGGFISPDYKGTLMAGGLGNIPALGGINGQAIFDGVSTFNLGGGSLNMDEVLTVSFSSLSATLILTSPSGTSGGLYSGSPVAFSSSGTPNSATGAISLATANTVVFNTLSSPVTLTLNASANMNSSNLIQGNLNYTITDGVTPATVSKAISFIPF